MHHRPSWTRRVAAASALPLALAMVSSAAAQSPSPGMDGMEMEDPPYAVILSGLEDGATVTENEVTVNVEAIGFTPSCAHAGKPIVEGVGHYHTILDGMLIDMECTPTATISLQNVAPGPHTIIALPALNNHHEIQAGAAMLSFEYAPTDPLPEIVAVEPAQPPTITIVSPAPGTEVSGEFEITVAVTDFTLSEDLYGKPDLAGFGHWHANVDATDGPMMGMVTMLGMSGTETFTASTEGLEAGAHPFFAILVSNSHMPFMEPVMASVELIVK